MKKLLFLLFLTVQPVMAAVFYPGAGGGLGTGATNIVATNEFAMNTWFTNTSGSNLFVIYGVTALSTLTTNAVVGFYVDVDQDGTWESKITDSAPSNTVSHSTQLIIGGAAPPNARYTVTNVSGGPTTITTTAGSVQRIYSIAAGSQEVVASAGFATTAGTATTATNVVGIPKTNVFFVSASGSDTTGNGTEGAPFQTISNAAWVAARANTNVAQAVYVKSGYYDFGGIHNFSNAVFYLESGAHVVATNSQASLFIHDGWPLTILGEGIIQQADGFNTLILFNSANYTTNIMQADQLHLVGNLPFSTMNMGKWVFKLNHLDMIEGASLSDGFYQCTNMPDLTFEGTKMRLTSGVGWFAAGVNTSNDEDIPGLVFDNCDIDLHGVAWEAPVGQTSHITWTFNGGRINQTQDCTEGTHTRFIFNGVQLASNYTASALGVESISGIAFYQKTNITFYSDLPSLRLTSFTSTNITISSTSSYNVPHGLSSTPRVVQCVLVCVTNDTGTAAIVGDEIPVQSLFDINTTTSATVFNTSSNLYVNFPENMLGGEGNYTLAKRTGTAGAPTSFNNFRLKFYAFP